MENFSPLSRIATRAPIIVPYNDCRTGCISWVSEYHALASTQAQLLRFKGRNEVVIKARNAPEEHTKNDKKERKKIRASCFPGKRLDTQNSSKKQQAVV